MKIDFTATSQNINNEIEYYNTNGDIVKKYPIKELDKWVFDSGLNLKTISENGRISSDPGIIEKEIEDHLDKYIDENWEKVTESFYIAKNTHRFVSRNKPQQTKEVI